MVWDKGQRLIIICMQKPYWSKLLLVNGRVRKRGERMKRIEAVTEKETGRKRDRDKERQKDRQADREAD